MTTKGERRMNANGNYGTVRQMAWRGLVFAALLAMVLFGAGVTRAQSGATNAPVSTAKPAAAAVLLPTPPVAKQPAKGSHEGIKVHGHWTIEVKNPDGSLVSRREFENAIDPYEGSDLLTGVLSGDYVPQGFYIILANPSGTGLCGNFGFCFLSDTRNPILCTVLESAGCGSLTYTPNSPAGTFGNATGYTLSGSVTPSTSGTISTVGSGLGVCLPLSTELNIPPSQTHGAPVATYTAGAASSTAFLSVPPGQSQSCQSSNLDYGPLNLTSTNIAAQPVGLGQSVSATVVITFGSN
jgi:hypothetical protein